MPRHAVGIEVSKSDHRDAAIGQDVEVLELSFKRVGSLDRMHDRQFSLAPYSLHVGRRIGNLRPVGMLPDLFLEDVQHRDQLLEFTSTHQPSEIGHDQPSRQSREKTVRKQISFR